MSKPNPKTVWPSDPPYLQAAFSVLGLSEIEGPKHEKKVLEMYAASGHPEIHDDETPWCAAFIGWSLAHGGEQGTHSLLARSYASYGKAVDRNQPIPRGAIAVWTRTGGAHVNFVLVDNGDGIVTCMGGNQGNGKGGGVTISRRNKSEAIAYRMPPVRRDAAAVLAEADPPPKKSLLKSKIATVAAAGEAYGATEVLGSINDAAAQVSTLKDSADHIGVTTYLAHLVATPRFWMAIAIIVGLGCVIYWRWREHGRGAT